jgi:hypothetical protein
MAFVKFVTTDPDGIILMQAHKHASGADYHGEHEEERAPQEPTTKAYDRLMALADLEKRNNETVAQAFSRLYQDPKHKDLVATDKSLHSSRVGKAIGL